MKIVKDYKERKNGIYCMSIQHLLEAIVCPYSGIGLIGKMVAYNLRDNRNYMSEIVVITKYIYLRCLVTIYQEVRDFQV